MIRTPIFPRTSVVPRARVVERETFAEVPYRMVFFYVHEFILLKPHQNGVDSSFHNICEAKSIQPPRDFVAVGFSAVDNFKDTAAQARL